jgi:hypothetical protein
MADRAQAEVATSGCKAKDINIRPSDETSKKWLTRDEKFR